MLFQQTVFQLQVADALLQGKGLAKTLHLTSGRRAGSATGQAALDLDGMRSVWHQWRHGFAALLPAVLRGDLLSNGS